MNKNQIREHVEVLGSDDKHVGTVDHLEGESQIKLAKAYRGARRALRRLAGLALAAAVRSRAIVSRAAA